MGLKRGLLTIGAFAASAALLSPAPARADQSTPGFKAYLGRNSDNLVECNVFRERLLCLRYRGEPPAQAQCDFGGAVPSVELTRRSRARVAYTCINEANHDYPLLRVGRRFRSGAFRCTHRPLRRNGDTQVRCSNGVHTFAIAPPGRIRDTT